MDGGGGESSGGMYTLADTIGAELDAVFTLKLGFPGNPELAIGAVAEGGKVLLDRDFVARLGIEEHAEEEKERALVELARRAVTVRDIHPRVPLAGRTVVVTDDGVASGSTIRAALRAVRGEKPRALVGAVPVGCEGAVEKLGAEADDMVCLRCPPSFLAVSQFYRHFPQVEDDGIVRLFRP